MADSEVESGGRSRSRQRRKAKGKPGPEISEWDRRFTLGLPQWVASAWVLLVAAIGLLISPGVSRPYPGVTVALGGLTALLASVLLFFFKISDRGNRVHGLCLAWLFWCVLSSVWSLDLFRSLQTVASWTGAVGLFIVATFIAVSGLHWRALVWGLSVIATAITLYGLMNLDERGQLLATFSNRDNFAVIPLIGFFLALSQTQWYQLPGVRYVAWLQAVLMGLAVGRSSSRAAALGLVAGVLLTGLFLSLDKNQSRKRKVAKGTILGLALMLTLALGSGLLMPLFVRVEELRKGEDRQGVVMREDVLVYGLRTSLDRPVQGSGPGTFSLAYQAYRPQSVVPDYIYVNVAHNDPIEVVVETGWVGFVLLGSMWLLVISRALRLVRHGQASWEASALVGGIGSLATYSALNFVIAVPVLLFWEMLLLGSLQALPVRTPEPLTKRTPGRLLWVVFLAVLGGWSSYFGFKSWRANQQVQLSEKLAAELRWEDSLECLEKGLSIQPQARLYSLRGTLRGRLAKFKNQKQELGRIAEDHEMAAKLSPRDPFLAKARLVFFESAQMFGQAEATLLKMKEFSPYEQWHNKELVRLQLLQGKLKDAARTVYENFDAESQGLDLLAPILVNLEIKKPGDAMSMFLEWGHEEGDVSRYLQLATATAEYALAKSLPAVAERILLFVSEQDANSGQALYLLTRAYALQGKPLKRREYLARLLRLPADARNDRYLDLALVEWAKSQQKNQDSKALVLKLQKRLQESPQSPSIRLFLSEFYLKQNKIEEATELISQGLDYSPEDPRLLARMGTCLFRQGLNDMAADYFSQALKLDPSNLEARRGSKKMPIVP